MEEDNRSELQKHLDSRKGYNARRDLIINRALYEGFKTGAAASIAMGGFLFIGHRVSPIIRHGLSVSAKSALVLMAGAGMGTLRAELLLGHREEWANGQPTEEEIEVEKRRAPFVPHLRAANFIYRHPFETIAGLGATAVGTIFWHHRHTNLSFLQQILHTRVVGQGSVLATVAGIMLFREWMKANGGPFEIPGEEPLEEDYPVGSFGRYAKADIDKLKDELEHAKK